MAEKFLKPIRTLRSKSDVRSFSHIRPLDADEFFTSFWTSVFELVFAQKDLEMLLELFNKFVYFFPGSTGKEFQEKHAIFVKKFSRVVGAADYFEVKNLLYGDEFWSLLKDIEKWVEVDAESYIAPIVPLLEFLKINIIEKFDGYQDTELGVSDAYFTAHLFETETEIFLLHPKDKIVFPRLGVEKEEAEGREESPLLVENDDTVVSELLNTQEYVLENSFSDTETDWQDTINVLNNGKSPLILIEKISEIIEPEKIEDLGLKKSDLDKFKEALLIDCNKFLKDLTLHLLKMLIDEELFHLALSIFSNTVYFYPQSQTKSFDQKFLKFIQDFVKHLNSNDKDKANCALNSSEMEEILNDIQIFAGPCDYSLVSSIFPLIKTWKISIIEKNYVSEYYWKVNKPLTTLTLYEKSGQAYLMVPKAGLGIKKLDINEGELEVKDDSLILEQDSLETEILNDSNSVLEVYSDCESEFDPENIPLNSNENDKNVKFKPNLEIDIPSLTISSQSSPIKSAIKNSSYLPQQINKPQGNNSLKPPENGFSNNPAENDPLNSSICSYTSMQVKTNPIIKTEQGQNLNVRRHRSNAGDI